MHDWYTLESFDNEIEFRYLSVSTYQKWFNYGLSFLIIISYNERVI